MRGFIQIPLLIAFLVGAVAFGGGGYYVANKVNHSSQAPIASVAMSVEAQASTTADIATTTEQIVQSEVVKSQPKKEQVVTGAAELPVTPATVQATVAVDVCTNIEGIQSVAPYGMLISRTHGCLTEEALDKLNEADADAAAAKRAASLAAENEVKKKAIQAQIDLYTKFPFEIDAGYYTCKLDSSGHCPDVTIPKNRIPKELKDIINNYSPSSSATIFLLYPGNGALRTYINQQINLKILDLNAQLNQL